MNDHTFSIKLFRLINKNLVYWVFLLAAIPIFLLSFMLARDSRDEYSLSKYRRIDLNTIQFFDPYYESKQFLPVPEKIGFLIDFDSDHESKYIETVLSPYSLYKFAFLDHNNLIDEILIETAQSSKIVQELPVSLLNKKFTRVIITPVNGSNYYISYLNFIKNFDDNSVLKEYSKKEFTRVYQTDETGDPHKVSGIIAYLESYENKKLTISIGNIGPLPVSLISITNPDNKAILLTGNEISAMENNIVDYKSFTLDNVDQDFVKGLQSLSVTYRYLDDEKIHTVPVYPFMRRNDGIFNSTIIRESDTTTNFPFINTADGKVTFEGNEFQINEPLIIPPDKEVIIQEGQTFDLSNGAFILSYSPINAIGTEDKPITFVSSDGTGLGLVVIKPKFTSYLSHVNFDNLSNPTSGIWYLTGAVTFYEADVEISHSIFQNNRCEDALHIMRSEFVVNNCSFLNTFADAFDSDFSTGHIYDSSFSNTGNDGLDFSTSQVLAERINFSEIGDKGISAGENSNLTIRNITVKGAVIGITSKDFSMITGDSVKISDVKIGMALYQKKPEFGPANIDLSNTKVFGSIGLDYLIQKGSTLFLDDEEIVPRSKKKERLIIEKLISGEEISW